MKQQSVYMQGYSRNQGKGGFPYRKYGVTFSPEDQIRDMSQKLLCQLIRSTIPILEVTEIWKIEVVDEEKNEW